eukprot:4498775-Alexandrium_andersonii.AAC.1
MHATPHPRAAQSPGSLEVRRGGSPGQGSAGQRSSPHRLAYGSPRCYMSNGIIMEAVSYTHLTLPTIC